MIDMEAVKARLRGLVDGADDWSTVEADVPDIRALLAENERLEASDEIGKKLLAGRDQSVARLTSEVERLNLKYSVSQGALEGMASRAKQAEKLLEIAMDCAPTRTLEALRPAAPPEEPLHVCDPLICDGDCHDHH